MAKYDIKILNDYINGNDISGYTLEELENDKLFMEHVIDITCDYKMYNHASFDVKTNPGFIRFLIKRFSDKLDFLCNAVDFYFDNTKDEHSSMEIAIIMTAILKSKDDDRFLKYEMMRDVLYAALRLQVEEVKYVEREDYEFQYDTGLGFWYIFDVYKNNEIVTDFYAKKMLKELFIEDYYALDRVIHRQYSSVKEIENKGKVNVLIDAIRVHDNMLASYICVHKDLLKRSINKLDSAIKRWDKYVDIDESNRFDMIYEQVKNYMDDDDKRSLLSGKELETVVGMQLGIDEKLVKYGIIDQIDVDLYEEDKKYYSDIISSSFKDRLNYKNIKMIMKKLLIDDEIIDRRENSNCKILRMEDYRNNKKKTKSGQK